MGQRLTSLWLVLRKRTFGPPVLRFAEEEERLPLNNGSLLIIDGINPTKQRKGKSGETARRKCR